MAHPLQMELSSDLATGLIVLNRALMLTVSLFCFGVVDAGVYKWIDKEGRIQYSDAPPLEIKATEVHTRISTIACGVQTRAARDVLAREGSGCTHFHDTLVRLLQESQGLPSSQRNAL